MMLKKRYDNDHIMPFETSTPDAVSDAVRGQLSKRSKRTWSTKYTKELIAEYLADLTEELYKSGALSDEAILRLLPSYEKLEEEVNDTTVSKD